jgi:hypothetical protein
MYRPSLVVIILIGWFKVNMQWVISKLSLAPSEGYVSKYKIQQTIDLDQDLHCHPHTGQFD